MKKIINLFTGGWGVIAVKVALTIAALIVLKIIVSSGWHWLAQKEPRTRKQITRLNKTIKLTQDTLYVAKNNLILALDKSAKDDSVIASLKSDLEFAKVVEGKHQKMLLEQKKQIERYKEAGVYYLYIKKLGKDEFRESTKGEIDELLKK